MHAQETAQSACNFRLHAAFVCMRHSSACKQSPACKQPQPFVFSIQVLCNMRLHAAVICMQPPLACSIHLHAAFVCMQATAGTQATASRTAGVTWTAEEQTSNRNRPPQNNQKATATAHRNNQQDSRSTVDGGIIKTRLMPCHAKKCNAL